MTKSKSILVFLLCAMLLTTIAACGGAGQNQDQTTQAQDQTTGAVESTANNAPSGPAPVTYDPNSKTGGLKLPLTTQPASYTYLGTNFTNAEPSAWTIWNDIKEATGIEIKATVDKNWNDKVKMLIASNKMPDIFYNNYTYGYQDVFKLGKAGVLLPIDQYLDYMPNFKYYLDQNPQMKSQLTAPDGHIYSTPQSGSWPPYDLATGMIYRKDILDGMGITPKWDTMDDFYNTLKQIKDKVPEYYPFTHERSDWGFYYTWQLMFGTGNEAGMYYQDATNTWNYSFLEDNFKAELMFINKLQTDKLLDPNWLTNGGKLFWEAFGQTPYKGGAVMISNTTWLGPKGSNLWANYDKTGVMELEFLPPFGTGLPNAKKAYPQDETTTLGFLLSAKAQDPQLLCQLIDFCYSEQGGWLTTFGKEGRDYTLKDGMPIPVGGDGTGTVGDYNLTIRNTGRGFPMGMDVYLPTDTRKPPYVPQEWVDVQTYMKDNNMGVLRTPHMLFTDVRNQFAMSKLDSINKYALGEADKFATGQRPFSEWGAFVDQVKTMGVQDLINVYNDQWKEQQAAQK